MLDPHTGAELSVDDIVKMVDELIDAPRRVAARIPLGRFRPSAKPQRTFMGFRRGSPESMFLPPARAGGKTFPPRRPFLSANPGS